MSFLRTLFMIFLILKLTGNLLWSWSFVFLPALVEFGIYCWYRDDREMEGGR